MINRNKSSRRGAGSGSPRDINKRENSISIRRREESSSMRKRNDTRKEGWKVSQWRRRCETSHFEKWRRRARGQNKRIMQVL